MSGCENCGHVARELAATREEMVAIRTTVEAMNKRMEQLTCDRHGELIRGIQQKQASAEGAVRAVAWP